MPAKLPPAPNEPLGGISEGARQWFRIEHHVYPLLDSGKINMPNAADMAGVELPELLNQYRIYCLRNRETTRPSDS